MKKQLLLSLALCIVFTGCAGTSVENSNTTTSTQDQTNLNTSVELPTGKRPAQFAAQSLVKNTFVTFDDNERCQFYRCTIATQTDGNGNIVASELKAPAGYEYLEVDALPKDYLLIIKDGKVYSYQPSTQKIAPFIIDDTKTQLSLEKDQGLYAKEAFNQKGNYLFIAFRMDDAEVSQDIGPGVFINTSATPDAFFTYDSTKDILLSIKNPSPENNFLDYTAPTDGTPKSVKGELTFSPFLYDALNSRTISWFGHAYEIYRGPWGDYMPSTGPVKITSLTGEAIKQIPLETFITTDQENGNIFFVSYKGLTTVDANSSHPVKDLESVTILNADNPNLEESKITVSPKVTSFFETRNSEVDINFLTSFSYATPIIHLESNKLTFRGMNGNNVLFTLTKNEITSAEFAKSTDTRMY